MIICLFWLNDFICLRIKKPNKSVMHTCTVHSAHINAAHTRTHTRIHRVGEFKKKNKPNDELFVCGDLYQYNRKTILNVAFECDSSYAITHVFSLSPKDSERNINRNSVDEQFRQRARFKSYFFLFIKYNSRLSK